MNQLQVDVVLHLVLQVYLGPTGEKKLYHINVTTITSQHEGSLAILRRQNEKVLAQEWTSEQTIDGVQLLQDSNPMGQSKSLLSY